MPALHDPKRAFVCVMSATNYQVPTRLSATEGHEFACQAILDTGSGPTLIRQDLLPRGLPLSSLGDLKGGVFHDVNGGFLPLVGCVTLWVEVGTHRAPVCFGVVPHMSVGVILGGSYLDVHVRAVHVDSQTVEMVNGSRVPIIRGEAHRRKPRPNRDAVCACPPGPSAPVRLARKTRIPGNSIAHIWVESSFTGPGFFRGRHALFLQHGIHVAPGPVPTEYGKPFLVQVANPRNHRVKLPARMKVGVVEGYEGSILAVSAEQLSAGGNPPSEPEKIPELPELDVGGVPPSLAERLRSLLRRYRSLWDGQLGTIRQTEHRIQLKPGATPVRQHPYKAGPRAREMEREQVARMLKLDVIEPTTSEWASPVVMVPKPDGTPRFCIDYRRLNERTVKDSYPIPRMDECLDSLGEARVFSTLDCNAGYWQIPVAREDRGKTAFTCHWGAYQCKRLPFGLSNAPATFQRAMDMILAGVKWQTCLIYLDDVIVFSRSPEEHLTHLEEVLSLLQAAGVTLKAAKCHLFQKEVDYLGHVISPGRVAVNEKNTKALRLLAYPRTQTELKSFLGMCGVYRRFVKDFAALAKPLTRLTSTKLASELGAPTSEQLRAFNALREKLLSPPVLALARLEGDFILDVDASYRQLGCSLLQRQPDGEYHPVGYYSRALEPREENYFVTEVEALGVVWAVTHLRAYLEGVHFVIRCDHSALRGIFMGQSPNARLTRWRLLLSEFDYELQYKPGKDHKVADALSRLPTDGLDTTPIAEEIPTLAVTRRRQQSEEEENSSDTSSPTDDDAEPQGDPSSGLALDASETEGAGSQPIPTARLVAAQAEDAFCKGQREALDRGVNLPFQVDEKGILCRRAPLDGSVQVVIPAALRQEILRREHEPVHAGHPGSTRMYNTMRRKYYWPSMVADVYAWVAQCSGCARNRVHGQTHTSLMRLFPATEPFSGLAMDLLGPLPTSRNGHRFILVICDRFTKLTRAIPLKVTTALAIASVFLDHWVAAYGVPDTVLTDNGPQFAAVFLQGVLGMLGIVTNFTTPYHPQTNGQVERFNRTLVRQLRHYVLEHQDTWDRYLSLLTLAYNTQVHTSTGEIPFSLVCPRRLPTLALERFPHVEVDKAALHAEDAKIRFVEHLKEILPTVRKHLAKAQALYKRKFDLRVLERNKAITPGQWVFVRVFAPKQGKLSFKAEGPFMVVRTAGYMFLVESPTGFRTVSSDHITAAPAPPDGDPAWERAYDACGPNDGVPQAKRVGHEYVFERIVDHMWTRDNRLVLRLRWFGCSPEEDSWESATDVPREHVRRYAKRRRLSLAALERRGVLFCAQERKAALARTESARKSLRRATQQQLCWTAALVKAFPPPPAARV